MWVPTFSWRHRSGLSTPALVGRSPQRRAATVERAGAVLAPCHWHAPCVGEPVTRQIRHNAGSLVRRMMATSVPICFSVPALLIVLLVPLCVGSGSSSHVDARSRLAAGTVKSALVLAERPVSQPPTVQLLEDIDGDAPPQRWNLPACVGFRVPSCQWRMRLTQTFPLGSGSARGPPPVINRA